MIDGTRELSGRDGQAHKAISTGSSAVRRPGSRAAAQFHARRK